MSLQDTLRRAAGLLIELPQQRPGGEDATQAEIDALLAENADEATTEPRTVEDVVRQSDGPNLDEIAGNLAQSPSAPTGTGAAVIECASIYSAAKLPDTPFSAEQMLDMLASLPQELPLDTKRQTVKVTLGALGKTLGATPDSVVADASRKIAALAAYGEHLKKRTEEFAANSEAEIAALQAQIEEKRTSVLNARRHLTQSTQTYQAESERLSEVLEFFSLDLPPSKYASQADTTTPDAN